MGDRGNIVLKQENGDKIYFYTHWRGSSIQSILRDALVRGQGRWDDEPYLARIIFCELVKGYEMETTGFGISTYECDNEHPHLIVNCGNGTVERDNESWTFLEFAQLDDKTLKSMKGY